MVLFGLKSEKMTDDGIKYLLLKQQISSEFSDSKSQLNDMLLASG